MHHLWNAPDIGAVPGPTSVVVQSNCGLKHTLPAYEVREWRAKAVPMPEDKDCCPACLAVHVTEHGVDK